MRRRIFRRFYAALEGALAAQNGLVSVDKFYRARIIELSFPQLGSFYFRGAPFDSMPRPPRAIALNVKRLPLGAAFAPAPKSPGMDARLKRATNAPIFDTNEKHFC